MLGQHENTRKEPVEIFAIDIGIRAFFSGTFCMASVRVTTGLTVHAGSYTTRDQHALSFMIIMMMTTEVLFHPNKKVKVTKPDKAQIGSFN
jgi:hypothetical protein